MGTKTDPKLESIQSLHSLVEAVYKGAFTPVELQYLEHQLWVVKRKQHVLANNPVTEREARRLLGSGFFINLDSAEEIWSSKLPRGHIFLQAKPSSPIRFAKTQVLETLVIGERLRPGAPPDWGFFGDPGLSLPQMCQILKKHRLLHKDSLLDEFEEAHSFEENFFQERRPTMHLMSFGSLLWGSDWEDQFPLLWGRYFAQAATSVVLNAWCTALFGPAVNKVPSDRLLHVGYETLRGESVTVSVKNGKFLIGLRSKRDYSSPMQFCIERR